MKNLIINKTEKQKNRTISEILTNNLEMELSETVNDQKQLTNPENNIGKNKEFEIKHKILENGNIILPKNMSLKQKREVKKELKKIKKKKIKQIENDNSSTINSLYY